MKKFLTVPLLLLLMFFTFFTTLATAESPASIKNYTAIFMPGLDQSGHQKIAIRQYSQDGKNYYLTVDPYSFLTQIMPADALKSSGKSMSMDAPEVRNTPYVQALYRYTSAPYPLSNAGLTHAPDSVNGQFLTVDMCPSKKPFEKDFFEKLVTLSEKNQQPTPVALSMSGLWITRHPDEFAWLIKQVKANKLQVTWVNHSYTHVYNPKAPLANNFMLTPGTDVGHEVLDNEKLLLSYGLTPSVFFRFPGLISDPKLGLALRAYGLIPLGSDAWLAKGQKPQSGSIILVHGNSNEHAGIELIMPMLNDSNLKLLPLSQGLEKAQ